MTERSRLTHASLGDPPEIAPFGATDFRRDPKGKTMGYKVAVVGATGNVGREMMKVLAERAFPADEVYALASRRSLGAEVSYG